MHLYIICHADGERPSGPVKIGIGNNPRIRVRDMQTGNPRKLDLWTTFKLPHRMTAHSLEKHIHSCLADKRLMGEWFNIEPQHATILVRHVLVDAWRHALGYDEAKIEAAIEATEAGAKGLMPDQFKFAACHA